MSTLIGDWSVALAAALKDTVPLPGTPQQAGRSQRQQRQQRQQLVVATLVPVMAKLQEHWLAESGRRAVSHGPAAGAFVRLTFALSVRP